MMNTTEHAILSASSAARWMTCTRSATRGALTASDTRTEQGATNAAGFAQEGTAAHQLAELYLRYYIRQISEAAFEHQHHMLRVYNPYYSQLMEDHVRDYLRIVTKEIDQAIEHANRNGHKVEILLEERLSYSQFAPEGYGTADVVIISGGVAEVIDLKYGAGIAISAINNPQTRLYALGVYQRYEGRRDIQTITTRIIQPRLNSDTTETLNIVDLLNWAEQEVKPRAVQAWNGAGEFVPGEHCRFCPLAATCSARIDAMQSHTKSGAEQLLRHTAKAPSELTNEQIAEVLELVNSGVIEKWMQAVKDTAKERIGHGQDIPGWYVGTGKWRRKYTDEQAVIDVMTNTHHIDEIAPRKPLGIGYMEQLLGKDLFGEKLGGLITKTPGKLNVMKV